MQKAVHEHQAGSVAKHLPGDCKKKSGYNDEQKKRMTMFEL